MTISYNKLSPRRLADVSGPRRRKPPIQRQRAALRKAIAREKALLAQLVRDADLRKTVIAGHGLSRESLSVWADCDLPFPIPTEVNPKELMRWKDLTEHLKADLGFYAGLEFGCYAFTANLLPELERKWVKAEKDVPSRIQKRLKRELDNVGLETLPYFYVIESRSRSGKSRTGLHIHGYAIIEDALVATKLKAALRRNQLSRIQRQRGVDVRFAYDRDIVHEPGRWISYSLKNAGRYDTRIRGRRVYFSRSLTQITQSFWELLKESPPRRGC